MPTIATMFNSRLPPHSIAGYTTKTVQGTYWMNGFPTNGQAKELPFPRWVRPWNRRPENLTGSLPTQGRVTSAKIGNYWHAYAIPRSSPIFPRILDFQQPQSNKLAATTEVKYLGSIPWYHLYPEGMTYTKGRYSLEPCCILPVLTISGVWGSTKSRPQSYAFSKSPASGQTKWSTYDHKDIRSNKWSYHKWSNTDHFTATLIMPRYQIGIYRW